MNLALILTIMAVSTHAGPVPLVRDTAPSEDQSGNDYFYRDNPVLTFGHGGYYLPGIYDVFLNPNGRSYPTPGPREKHGFAIYRLSNRVSLVLCDML